MELLVFIPLVVILAYVLTSWAHTKKIPAIVVLILFGLALGQLNLKNQALLPNQATLGLLSNLGLLSLMFLAGVESSWREIVNERWDALSIAFSGAIIPLVIAFTVFTFLGYSPLTSFVMGICMSITAEAAKARWLMEVGKIKSKVGSAMLGAGILDDMFGIGMFILLTAVLGNQMGDELLLLLSLMAFFIGIAYRIFQGRGHLHLRMLRRILLSGIVPFFFIDMGSGFNLGILFVNLEILVLVVIVGTVGKLLGTFMAKPFTSFSWKQMHLIGWAMNSRGALELALALIAFRNGLIPVELYSGLVVLALGSTLFFPFIGNYFLMKNRRLMG